MSFKPITKYVPVLDTLHLNLTLDTTRNVSVLPSDTICDFASATRFKAETIYKSNEYALEVSSKKDNTHHLVYLAKMNGFAFGEMYIDRKNPFGNQKDHIRFELLNSALYSNWVPVLTGFFAAFKLKIRTFSQIHIALDTNQDPIRLFYKLQDSPKYLMCHGRKLSEEVDTQGTRKAGGKRQDSLYIGSSKSAKQTVIYNKTLEINKNRKYYITNYHFLNGLDTIRTVHRIELRLKHDVLKKYYTLFVNEDGEFMSAYKMKREPSENMSASTYRQYNAILNTGIDYTQFTNADYLVALFNLFSNLDFRHVNNKVITRCTPYDFIDFSEYNKVTIMRKLEYKLSCSSNLRNQRQAIRTQVEMFKRTGYDVVFSAAVATAAEYNLGEYLNKLIAEYNIESMITYLRCGDQHSD